jgi:hypothetical protein
MSPAAVSSRDLPSPAGASSGAHAGEPLLEQRQLVLALHEDTTQP